MEVAAQRERLQHRAAVGHVGENAQLELAVIGDDERVAGFGGEGVTDTVEILGD